MSVHVCYHIEHPTARDARAVMHVGIANRGGGKNVPGIPGTCTTRNLTYLERGPCPIHLSYDTYVYI